MRLAGLSSPGASRKGRLRRSAHYRALRRFWERLKGKTLHRVHYLLIASLLAAGILSYTHYRNSLFYVVRIDGIEAGLVCEVAEVEQFLNSLMDKCGLIYGMEVFPRQAITMTRELRLGQEANLEQVEKALRNRISLLTEAVMVTVDGVPVSPVCTAEEIADVIETLSLSYIDDDDSVKLLEVELEEELAGEDCVVPPEQVCSAAEVANLLLDPEKLEQDLDLQTASRLSLASRDGRENRIDGSGEKQEIPLVHVKTVEEATQEEPVPFPTTYVNNNEMYKGESRVVTEGKDGLKEVTYRVTRVNGEEIDREKLSERIIKEPVAKVIERGTLSRFAWPVAGGGRLSQGFSGRHNGIDIAAPSGTSVLAAESGTVVCSSWGPATGNYIVIYHGDYWTVYLHNSRNLVSAGQSVSRGQVIAKVGSSGNSTGPHLHFEVRRGTGSSKWPGYYYYTSINPLSFF